MAAIIAFNEWLFWWLLDFFSVEIAANLCQGGWAVPRSKPQSFCTDPSSGSIQRYASWICLASLFIEAEIRRTAKAIFYEAQLVIDAGLIEVAPNAEASLLLARSYSGVTHVDQRDVQAKLAPLALSMLRCEEANLATLTRWGIRNLGELAALPETALVSRIGQQGSRLQRLALGVEDHLLVPEDPAFVLSDHVLWIHR